MGARVLELRKSHPFLIRLLLLTDYELINDIILRQPPANPPYDKRRPCTRQTGM